jgi:hypothetical protein
MFMRAKFINEALISYNQWEEDVITNLKDGAERDPEYWDWFRGTETFKDITFLNWEQRISARRTADEILKMAGEI